MLHQIGIISSCLAYCVYASSLAFNSIQTYNLQQLEESLSKGYGQFCDSNIDPAIMFLSSGGDPQDVTVEFIGRTAKVTASLADLHKIFRNDFDYSRKTLIFINGFYSPHEDTLNLVRNIAKCSNLYNVLILNFARNLHMLYNTAVYNIPIYAYVVAKVLHIFLGSSVVQHQIILVGYSQGAYIASEAARLFHEKHTRKLPLVIILDPAVPCYPGEQHINREVAEQVLVIHTSRGRFGLKDALGTIDYYTNDIDELQPGCKDTACSHQRAVEIFAESVCIPGSLLGKKCKDWRAFQSDVCDRDESPIRIGVGMPTSVKGTYFGATKRLAPYGLGIMGIMPLNRQARKV